MGTAVLWVACNVPDTECARRMAVQLVEAGLAACVNIGAPVESIYRWQGAIETAAEIPLWIKTTEARYPALEARIRALHPYQVPEILALPVTTGLAAYLDWVRSES